MTETKQIEIQAKFKQLVQARDLLKRLTDNDPSRMLYSLPQIKIDLGDYTVTHFFDAYELAKMREQAVKAVVDQVTRLEEDYAAL